MAKSRLLEIDLENVVCPYCNQVAELMTGRELYGEDSVTDDQNFWVCKKCDAYVGCHRRSPEYGIEGNEPLGRLANRRLRMARIKVHIMFDPLWKVAGWDRTRSYEWLAKRLGMPPDDCHVANFDLKTCVKAIKALEGIRPLLNLEDEHGRNRHKKKKD